MNRLIRLSRCLLLLPLLVGFAFAPAFADETEDQPAGIILAAGKKTKPLSGQELTKWSSALHGENANFPGQRILPVKTILEKAGMKPGDELVFHGPGGDRFQIRTKDATSEAGVALLSTMHGQWKLVRMGPEQGTRHSYLLRSVSKVSVDSTAAAIATSRPTGCADARIYHSLEEALKNRQSACVLNLGGQNLRELPTKLFELSELRELYLGRNQLKTLPPDIKRLKNLETLIVGRNALTTLPPEIGQLQRLKVLKVGRNQIDRLPPEIGQLTKVELLELDNNRLRVLTPEIARMERLEELELDDNPLEDLPLTLRDLKHLKSIELGKEAFTPAKRQELSKAFEPIKIEWE